MNVTLAEAAAEARRRPGVYVFAGFGSLKKPWEHTTWLSQVRSGKKASLTGSPADWLALTQTGALAEDGEFIPDDPDEEAMGDRTFAKWVQYVGTE